ncbi:MAG: asparagine synthase (glutamine-hydrolyzing) [Chloroflexi bacterium]|nr:asparagine synthase (glutamine-hydrolyzing) [Chloroflexota bacterium]
MCGIIGCLSPKIDRARLEAANCLLRHRGPDDAGYFAGEGVGLAARRLSIVDLAGGHQPLSNEDGSIWIAYNGEVMNAPELRAELQAAGHRFRSRADTEIIVHGYEEWGAAVLPKLRGMFAFALWDGRTRQLLLARDRFGIKPLYYAQTGGQFAFASEIRPLFALLPQLSRRAHPAALAAMFRQGFIPTPQTAFAGVLQLPAAHMLVVGEGVTAIRPYWQLQFPADGVYRHVTLDEAVDGFMARLRDAVSAWRMSDVPVGSLLSGGIDSSALAALLTEISGPIHTFHIQFEAASHDESAYAQQVAQSIGSQHHTLSFTQADFDLLPRVTRHLEAPQCSATSIPIYKLYRAAHEAGFKVILTGEGADELLGGYHWFDGDRRIRPYLHLPRFLRRPLSRLPRNVSANGRHVLAHGTKDASQRFALWQQVASPALLKRLLEIGDWRLEIRPPISNLQSPISQSPISQSPISQSPISNLHPLNQLLFLESQTRMVDFINFEVDRMSMASSVEARPPFLDDRLWDYVTQLPPEMKLNGRMNKVLLRLGMKDVLPTAVTTRPKQGLASPHAQWWRQEKLPAWAEECLTPDALAETGYFNRQTVGRLREEHGNGRADRSRVLMGVLTTQLWHQAMEVGV